MSFAEILEAVDNLPLNQQIMIVSTLKSRIIEKKRENLLKESQKAQQDYINGEIFEETADEFINRLSKK